WSLVREDSRPHNYRGELPVRQFLPDAPRQTQYRPGERPPPFVLLMGSFVKRYVQPWKPARRARSGRGSLVHARSIRARRPPRNRGRQRPPAKRLLIQRPEVRKRLKWVG